MKLFRVILPVTDIDLAERFYSQLLAIPGKRVSPGRHYFDCGGVILACFDPRADGDGVDLPANPDHIYIAVENLEAQFAQALASGFALPADGIKTRPWGERSFYTRDPFGNRLCFVDQTTVFTG